MALLLHELLCFFDEESYKPQFSVCWFPYTMVEMKEFKSIVLTITDELIQKNKFAKDIITKSILETASGVRMWQVLRTLSDYCLQEELLRSCSKT